MQQERVTDVTPFTLEVLDVVLDDLEGVSDLLICHPVGEEGQYDWPLHLSIDACHTHRTRDQQL